MTSTSETRRKVRVFAAILGVNMLALLVVAASSSASNLTDIPTLLGEGLGITAENAAFLLSIAILISVAVTISMVSKKNDIIMVAIPLIATMGFLVAIGWLPYWVLLVLAVLVGVQFAMKLKEGVKS